MEKQEYLIALMDGVRFKVTDVNLKTVNALMNNNKIFAVKLGNKSVQKQTIAYIAKSDTIVEEGNNVILTVANEVFYLSTENVDAKIEELTNSINQKMWVLAEDAVLFNRGCFQYLEEKIVEDTE